MVRKRKKADNEMNGGKQQIRILAFERISKRVQKCHVINNAKAQIGKKTIPKRAEPDPGRR